MKAGKTSRLEVEYIFSEAGVQLRIRTHPHFRPGTEIRAGPALANQPVGSLCLLLRD